MGRRSREWLLARCATVLARSSSMKAQAGLNTCLQPKDDSENFTSKRSGTAAVTSSVRECRARRRARQLARREAHRYDRRKGDEQEAARIKASRAGGVRR